MGKTSPITRRKKAKDEERISSGKAMEGKAVRATENALLVCCRKTKQRKAKQSILQQLYRLIYDLTQNIHALYVKK